MSKNQFDDWVEAMKVVGHPVRLRILLALYASDYLVSKSTTTEKEIEEK